MTNLGYTTLHLFKKSFLILAMVFTSIMVYSQDITECEKIVELVITSFNNNNVEAFEGHLSPDFTFAEQKIPIATMVLKQLFLQMDDNAISSKRISENQKEGILEMIYDITYEKKGVKEAVFRFNSSNQLTEFSLFELKIKTMNETPKVDNTDQNVIEIPFTLVGNLIAVKVLVNGVARQFVLDTGSPKVIVNSRYFTTEDSDKEKLSSVKGVGGYISDLDIVNIEKLDFYGIQLNQQDVLTTNLSHLENELNTEIYGLIGYDLIANFDILFDYSSRKLTFIKPEYFNDFAKLHLGDFEQTRLPLEINKHIPSIELQVGSQNLKMGIDSGAETSLISIDLFGELKPYISDLSKDTLVGADNSPNFVNAGKIKKAHAGSKQFLNMETVFADIAHLNLAYKSNIDGLLGFEFLSQQKTIISFERKELIFVDN